jgi:bla regulator protein blaR1
MADLAAFLTNLTDREVIDRTGLPGMFDVRLEYAREAVATAAATADTAAPGDDKPSIFTAVGEQLGLKLTPSKGPVEILVIDHVDRPIGN